jgi:hypothetical protein
LGGGQSENEIVCAGVFSGQDSCLGAMILLKFGLNVPARDGVHEREGPFPERGGCAAPTATGMNDRPFEFNVYGEYNDCHAAA